MSVGNGSGFGDEIDEYCVVMLRLGDYKGTTRSMPAKAEIAGFTMRPMIRRDEQRLLKMYFKNWQLPFSGSLPGWRDETPIYVLWRTFWGRKLVGGLYLCDRNEFNDDPQWGQVHYPFVDPKFKGKGLYSLLFCEAVRRARSWGLEGVYVNTDRRGHSELYERWGAVLYERRSK